MNAAASRYPIHFAVPAWGPDYVGSYLDACLPAQLSPGNVGALRREDGHRYTIYTQARDRARIETAPAVARLREMMEVRVEEIDAPTPGENKYHVKTGCYQHALRAAVADGAALFALNCDMVLADGFVARVVDALNAGIRLIEVPGSRTVKARAVADLLALPRGSDDLSIAIGPLDLARLWLRHRHPQLDQHTIQCPTGGPFHPSHLIWNVGDEGVLIRAFHVYPMVTRSLDPDVPFATLDDDLAANLAVAAHERLWAKDSRALFCCELSPLDYDVAAPVARGDLDGIVEFYLGYAKDNIHNLQREMIVTGCEVLSERWSREREAFAGCVAEIQHRYDRRRAVRRSEELKIPALPATPPGGVTDAETLVALNRHYALGEHPPADLRERCALIALARDPDDTEQVLRLCAALIELGKHIPLALQRRALLAHLRDDPGRNDLRARLSAVEGLIHNLS